MPSDKSCRNPRAQTQPHTSFLILLIAAWTACCQPSPSEQASTYTEYSAVVIAVSDGDTIKVLHKGQIEKIRLSAIDAPEKKQPFGLAAKEYVVEQCWRKYVLIQPQGRDRYGRTIAEVETADGQSLNFLLVSSGLAWWYRTYAPDDTELQECEQQARDLHLGLWAQPNPTPPWQYRRNEILKRASARVAYKALPVMH